METLIEKHYAAIIALKEYLEEQLTVMAATLESVYETKVIDHTSAARKASSLQLTI